jgi:rhodanese-related sulfurtransferase
MSSESAGLAVKMGYSNVKVMLQGAPGWKKEGNMVVASPDFIKNGNMVLVDLRAAKDAAAGHIPGAVNILLAELSDAEEDFPTMKGQAVIVLYGPQADVKPAAKIIKGWGYKAIAAVAGGFAGWQTAGNPVATGNPGREITWRYQPGPGEVTIEDFQQAGADQIILDVRGADETAAGMFAHALNIPLDELDKRMGELPQDKEFLVHCSTGARAEMAVQALQKAGQKARFLVAEINCEEGECEIDD